MPARHPVGNASRAICPLEAARDFAARESSDGGLDRHGGLDRDGDAGREDSREEAEERGGAATAVASDAWGAAVFSLFESKHQFR